MVFSISRLPGNFLIKIMPMDEQIIVQDDYYYYNFSKQFNTIVCRKNLSDYKSIGSDVKFDTSKYYHIVNDNNNTLSRKISESVLNFLDTQSNK